jgi:trimethylamine--corrinoid protein Co-methyltransferase
LAQLRAGTLQILERVGVHCPSLRAREIYRDHGAEVDCAREIVRLSPPLVLEAMSHAPRHYTLGARDPAYNAPLDGTGMYVATDGCGVETIDFETRQRRPSRKDDVARMARVADALSSVGFYWPIVSAQDHPKTAPLHELDASFNNTVKHVQTETVMDLRMARYAVEMANVAAMARRLSALPVLPPWSARSPPGPGRRGNGVALVRRRRSSSRTVDGQRRLDRAGDHPRAAGAGRC